MGDGGEPIKDGVKLRRAYAIAHLIHNGLKPQNRVWIAVGEHVP